MKTESENKLQNLQDEISLKTDMIRAIERRLKDPLFRLLSTEYTIIKLREELFGARIELNAKSRYLEILKAETR